jgi:hypothetical protein
MNRRGALVCGLTLALAAALAGGCGGMSTTAAPLPPANALQTGDLARLAGE